MDANEQEREGTQGIDGEGGFNGGCDSLKSTNYMKHCLDKYRVFEIDETHEASEGKVA